MIPILINIKETRPPDVSIHAWRRISRSAHAAAGALWHSEMLPRHFDPVARNRYHYQPRTAKYLRRKQRAFAQGKAVAGADTPLVFTGLLRESLMRLGTVRGFPSRVSVRMSGPRYITMRPFQSNQPDKAAEVTRVTRQERSELAKVLKANVVDGLAKYRATKAG